MTENTRTNNVIETFNNLSPFNYALNSCGTSIGAQKLQEDIVLSANQPLKRNSLTPCSWEIWRIFRTWKYKFLEIYPIIIYNHRTHCFSIWLHLHNLILFCHKSPSHKLEQGFKVVLTVTSCCFCCRWRRTCSSGLLHCSPSSLWVCSFFLLSRTICSSGLQHTARPLPSPNKTKHKTQPGILEGLQKERPKKLRKGFTTSSLYAHQRRQNPQSTALPLDTFSLNSKQKSNNNKKKNITIVNIHLCGVFAVPKSLRISCHFTHIRLNLSFVLLLSE